MISTNDIYSFFQLIWPFVGGALVILAWLKFFRKKEQRLFKNIQRPIIVIGTENKPMRHEFQLLKRVGLFNVEYHSSESRAADLMNGNRLVVAGYTQDSQIFKDIFNAAKQREIPIIVFADPNGINTDDMNLIKSYSHHSMCNTPLRLTSDVFALMSTFPEENK